MTEKDPASNRTIPDHYKDSFADADNEEPCVPDEIVEKEENLKERISMRGQIPLLKLKLATPDGLMRSSYSSMSSANYEERLIKAQERINQAERQKLQAV